jgi:hypothetical protein
MTTHCDCDCHGDAIIRVICRCHCHTHGDRGDPTGHRPDGTDGNPNRPGKHNGTTNGRLDQPNPTLEPGDLRNPNPPGVWVGGRADLFLPFLFMRANPGDTGTRPVIGPFWESPDILLVAGVEPPNAPDVPPALGETALANRPNTLYAHVWNFGQSQAPEVVVEFYWCDPSLGIGPASAHLIGQTFTTLGARGSGRAHRLVKCPVPWVPTFVNGGHECLVVRIWDMASDALGVPPWDASLNRHVAQRNIHVVQTGVVQAAMRRGAPAALVQALDAPVLIKIGPLFGMPAQVEVNRVLPHTMPWLQLHTGVRGKFPNAATPTGAPVLSTPRTIGGGIATGSGAARHVVTGEDQQVGFTTTDAHPGPGEAHVYRVTASQGGQLVGGYTVVVVG